MSEERGDAEEGQRERERRALRAMGITILGVLFSIGATVGMGLSAHPWWVRLASGVVVAVALGITFKLATRAGSRGPVARAADWITGN